MTVKESKRRVPDSSRPGVTPDVYDHRIPIYRAALQFVRDVSENLRPDLPLILKFARSVDEAAFLFDDSIADYLQTLFTKALRLHTLELMRVRIASDPAETGNFGALLREETDLADWFARQPDDMRVRFGPFLRLA